MWYVVGNATRDVFCLAAEQALGLLKQWEDESAILDELIKATESRNPQVSEQEHLRCCCE